MKKIYLSGKMEKKSKIINLQEENEKNQNDKNYFCPTPSKQNKEFKLVKPDFSPIIIQENQFGFKTNGSYKNKRIYEPELPIKSKTKKYSTNEKIQGKDLFGAKIEKSYCRKLNFNVESKIEEKKDKDNNTNNNSFFYDSIFNYSFFNNSNETYLKQNKMENEFIILKTLNKCKLDYVYKVEEKKTKKIYCIKKICKNSKKNNINNTQKLFNDMNNKKNIPKDKDVLFLGHIFCNHYKDFWVEEENLDIDLKDLYIPDKYLYILYDYYPNGDLLEYLEKLEQNKYNFTPDFYWDIIFEMIMGLNYFHELGYLHLDIKPTNYLVDQKGFLKLADFGLCHKISEISFLSDIIEGDKVYISKELLNFNSHGKLNTKTDIFSLGLSILEIMAKINLPLSGETWAELRSDNFKIKENLLVNWNINQDKEKFINLISKMIAPIDKREDLNKIINNFDELKKRYELLKNNEYKKSGEIPKF